VKEGNIASQSQPCGVGPADLTAGLNAAPSASEVWHKRRELYRLRGEVAKLAAEVRAGEQARERAKLKRLAPHQRRVLAALVDDHWDDEFTYYRPFSTIASWSGLTRPQVSRACKALRRLGFTQYARGLFTEDGEVAGSGYRITRLGHAWWWDNEHSPDRAPQGPLADSDKSREEP